MLTDRPARVLIGVVVLLLALVLMLPIPLGNLPPGFAVTVTGVGLSERDGLVASAGLLLSLAALAFTSAAAHGAVSAVAVAL